MLNLITRSSLFPIEVTIRSSNGTDLTPSVQILHSNIPPSTLQPRAFDSVPVPGCPLKTVYVSRSWCQRALSAQYFETLCTGSSQEGRVDIHHIGQGHCDSDSICVGSEFGDKGTSLHAYCISTDHFVQIGHKPSIDGHNPGNSGTVAARVNTLFNQTDGRSLAVEAVVTENNKITSFFANSVVVQAQSYEDGLWRTVGNSSAYCLRCSSMTLAPFPPAAQRVKVDVVLPKGQPTALLWLASYPY